MTMAVKTATLRTERLTATVAAEVLNVDLDRFVSDEALPAAVMKALEEHGVLVFRELQLDDETQVAFCSKLGAVREFPENPVPGIFVISRDPAKTPYDQRSNTRWHIDGVVDQDFPTKASMLSAKVLASEGGETEFASAYAAHDQLPDTEQAQVATLRVWHSLAASYRDRLHEKTPEQLAEIARRSRERPLVWIHHNGRKSLLLGHTADYVIGMDVDEGRALLSDLLARATTPERVYRHSWSVGDAVLWDNRGVFHRATPYDPTSGRELHRTTLLGDEVIAEHEHPHAVVRDGVIP
jgi:alpha-ketoglutarate-dependent taurine dioxygenase